LVLALGDGLHDVGLSPSEIERNGVEGNRSRYSYSFLCNMVVHMNMIPVQSSSISAIGYDEQSETLSIRFNNGRTYEFNGVPPEEFEALKNAPSIGSYFNDNIKGQY
jgi:hypothetical protein